MYDIVGGSWRNGRNNNVADITDIISVTTLLPCAYTCPATRTSSCYCSNIQAMTTGTSAAHSPAATKLAPLHAPDGDESGSASGAGLFVGPPAPLDVLELVLLAPLFCTTPLAAAPPGQPRSVRCREDETRTDACRGPARHQRRRDARDRRRRLPAGRWPAREQTQNNL
ncbi:hypothetical protein BC834DRAFT_565639 [Gloeopeniophorella convolvens]|nr:hypothetical protein BC834DRAFT_565639 [Gloeopeniophorella convolvens]